MTAERHLSKEGHAMTEPQKDTLRSMEAVKAILDGRDPKAQPSAILVTLEQAVAAVLLLTSGEDPRRAAGMLNNGLVAGVEDRLALYNSRISK